MSISKKLNIANKNWLSCKYKVSIEIIFSDNDVRKLEDIQILGLYLEKDYDNDHLPVLMVDLAISSLDENKVDDDTIFHVKMTQYYLENDDDTGEKKQPKVFMDERLNRIGYGQRFDTSESIEKTIRASNGQSDTELTSYDLTRKTTFVLVKNSDLIMSKKIINNVVVNSNMQNIVCWMLSEVECERKVLMSSFTNTTEYPELLLQPKPFLEQMVFLDNEFGWYKEGAYIFIDYDTFYIIRKNGLSTAWRKNDPTDICFCISSSGSSDSGSTGIIIDNNKVYVNVGASDYRLIDASIIEDQISGSNTILINTSTGESTKVITDKKALGTTGTFNTKMYHGHNPYIVSQIKRMKEENEHVWEIKCANCDISLFSPQMHFTFLSDVTKVSKQLLGSYRISSLKVSFIKNGNFFNNSSTIMVKRTSKQ